MKQMDLELINKAMLLMAEKIRSRDPQLKNWPAALVIAYFMMQAEKSE